MKSIFILLVLSIAGITISAFNFSNKTNTMLNETFEVPENINAIFDKSCIMCHNKESKNEKSRGKLMIDGLSELTKSQQISKLSKISKVVKKGEMPPEKFLAKYPEKALSDAEKKSLIDWSKNYAKELAK